VSGGVHHWLKRRSTREEREPVTRNDDDDDNNMLCRLGFVTCYISKSIFGINKSVSIW
jgi:hypothetical protein